MNFDFSDRKTIQDQARLVLSRECPPDRARQALEHARAYDETLWKQVAELGWPAIAIDEEFGGSAWATWSCASSPRSWVAQWHHCPLPPQSTLPPRW